MINLGTLKRGSNRTTTTNQRPIIRTNANTRIYNNSIPLPNTIVSNIYIIGGVTGGGSSKFINDIKQCFPQSINITRLHQLNSLNIRCNDIILLQHLVHDITYDVIIHIYKKTKCRVIINIHDFYYVASIHNPHNSYLHPDIQINARVAELFRIAELIIHPSQFTYNIYSKYFPITNFIISPHIDFSVLESQCAIPLIQNNTINIGVYADFSECKGAEYIRYLYSQVPTYLIYSIRFCIVGVNIPRYNNNEFFTSISKYNIHCLLLLNKWGETYCYALSKFLKSGLPILYNAIGAVKERIPDKPHYMPVFDHEVAFDDADKNHLVNRFTMMLEFIVSNQGKAGSRVDLTIKAPELYKFLFDPTYYNKELWGTIHSRIKPFCIYFPQFHRIQENDVNYYPGMTDMKNLIEYIKDGNIDNLDSPDLATLGINSLEDYDLSNPLLVNKQIDVARSAGIYGFCIYYYWFSTNTITNRNSIMERCYDNFFKDTIPDFKVFFNWANEDWTKNPAFVQDGSVNISNSYTTENINANFDNLSKYFLHPNYCKINNCPVFNIHHPWFMTDEELTRVIRIFNERAMGIGFDGVHIIVNSMVKKYNMSTFMFSPNYKDPKYKSDYTYLSNNSTTNTISTIFFSFNNSARMYKPQKNHLVKVLQSTEMNQKNAVNNIVCKYLYPERSEINKILLINSWNEWGEDMAIEPSTHKKDFYLILLKSAFTQLL